MLLLSRSTQWKREDPTPTAGSSTTSEQETKGGASSSGQRDQTQGTTEEKKDPEAEGLAQLIPDIQETAKLLQKVVQEFREQKAICSKMVEGAGKRPVEEASTLSAEEKYLASMKPLQFGECCISACLTWMFDCT